jgi:2-methylaconitate cis-trans-isomerase PrpF
MVKAHAGTDADIAVRMVSSDQFHKATPLTGAMCLAAAVAIPNTLPAAIALTSGGEIRIAHPSGVLAVGAASAVGGDVVDRVWAYRTARRIMEGRVVL